MSNVGLWGDFLQDADSLHFSAQASCIQQFWVAHCMFQYLIFHNGIDRQIFKTPLILLVLTLAGCSSLPTGGRENWIGYSETGQASFYADKFQNRKTASGEPYKHGLRTAAHRHMPFGSKVKVTNRKNGKSVVVKINDRGPFVRGRVIDLSKSAFSSIGNPAAGLLDVKIDVIR